MNTLASRLLVRSFTAATFSLAFLTAGCAATPDSSEDQDSASDVGESVDLLQQNLNPRAMLYFGTWADALERFECNGLNMVSTEITLPDGCTMTVQNQDCRVVSNSEGYWCVCDQVVTGASGCGGE